MAKEPQTLTDLLKWASATTGKAVDVGGAIIVAPSAAERIAQRHEQGGDTEGAGAIRAEWATPSETSTDSV
jgi:hypothetical protein